jgi:hypothetical protein
MSDYGVTHSWQAWLWRWSGEPFFPASQLRGGVVGGYRQRLRAAGSEEVLLQLPRATVAMLDAIKERHGLRNRSQAFLQLIEQKGATAQQQRRRRSLS